MAILNIYNNPEKFAQNPDAKKQIRFPQGIVPDAGKTYTAYGRNDFTSLYLSNLHYEDPKLPGYSMDGGPFVNLADTKYGSLQKKPSHNLDLSPNAIGDPKSGFTQKYLPGDDYKKIAEAADRAARSSSSVTPRTPGAGPSRFPRPIR